MVSYKTLDEDVREIESVALIDMECAVKLKEGQAIYGQVGNVLWRSPEAQAGICVGKPSDIWSFGATVSVFPHVMQLMADPLLQTLCVQ